MKATIKLTPTGYRLEIGGTHVDTYFCMSEAREVAISRGVTDDQIAWDVDPLPGAVPFPNGQCNYYVDGVEVDENAIPLVIFAQIRSEVAQGAATGSLVVDGKTYSWD